MCSSSENFLMLEIFGNASVYYSTGDAQGLTEKLLESLNL